MKPICRIWPAFLILLSVIGCNIGTESRTEATQLMNDSVSNTGSGELYSRNEEPRSDSVKGDFNGDGRPEYMWLVKPPLDTNGTGCIGTCNCRICFSDAAIPTIEAGDCIGGDPVNEGDLNANGTDEVGLLPAWFTSCWHQYHVWTLLNGKWIHAVEPFSTHCNQWDEGVKPIEIDNKRKGYVVVRYSDYIDEQILTRTKSVRIEK